ncbi:WD40/YVTN/BNR-like repeat-containing protein [Actinomadura chokoriensis]|uniref:Exo-alpha-sialidase n=1 Tax=Actinomadura chokoriensis TaxID=454156 RepID=A0ABV4QPY3_9ACTN
MTARTPEQDEAPRTVEDEPAGSRQIRRRLTFGVAGDIADMRASLSPWQRAYEAWRSAGLSWGHGAPPRERAVGPASHDALRAGDPPAAAVDAPEPPKPKTAPRKSAPKKPEAAKPAPAPKEAPEKSASKKPKAAPPAPAPEKSAPKKSAPKKSKPPKSEPGDVLVAGRPARKPSGRPAPSRRFRARAAVGAGLVVVAAGTVFAVAQRAEAPGEPGIRGPMAADELFALDPAATTDGLVQDLTTVAAAGGTIVAAGTEGDSAPGTGRTRFLVSADAGRAWTVAEVRTPDGATPPPGDTPRLISGGSGQWAALGRTPGNGTVAWTSDDAKTWTRRPLDAGFTPSDQVNDLTRIGQEFVAVGASQGRAIAWASADGRAWQRIDGVKGITGLDRVAATGNAVVAHGTYSRKVTQKKGRKKVTRTVRSEGFWRSADGGRTWAPVQVPQAQGSYGPTKGLAAGPGGFATVREGQRTTGSKKRRKTTRFGVLFTSADGQRWQVASRFAGSGIERFGGTRAGLAVVVRGAKGSHAILRSADGRTWQPGGSAPAPVVGSGLTVAAGGAPVLSGRQGDDAYLHGVDLRTVPGAVHAERSIRSLATAPGLSVAVGGTNGGAAIWTAPDGLQWTRAQLPGARGRLADAVRGNRGWLAVGSASGASPATLALTSQDGLSWQKAAFPAGPPPVAVATGPSGYVAVGPRAAWRSTDLRTWRQAGLDGVPSDVTATTGRYVAVGVRGKAPAIWTSPDAVKWTAAQLPPGFTAPLTQVAVNGATLVALSATATALVSTDAGATWAQRNLGPGVTATAVTPAPQGFIVTASSGDDAAVLTSTDGTTWRRLDVGGLSGPGDQRLTALATMGANVLATGTDHGTPTLWHAPIPR